MNSYNIAQELLAHLSASRQVGHTTVAIAAAKAIPTTIIVAHNLDMKEGIRKMTAPASVQITTLGEIENHALRGKQAPIIMDNAALQVLLGELVGTIASLRKSNQDMADKIRLAKAILQ